MSRWQHLSITAKSCHVTSECTLCNVAQWAGCWWCGRLWPNNQSEAWVHILEPGAVNTSRKIEPDEKTSLTFCLLPHLLRALPTLFLSVRSRLNQDEVVTLLEKARLAKARSAAPAPAVADAEAVCRREVERRRAQACREIEQVVRTVEFNDPFIDPQDVFK